MENETDNYDVVFFKVDHNYLLDNYNGKKSVLLPFVVNKELFKMNDEDGFNNDGKTYTNKDGLSHMDVLTYFKLNNNTNVGLTDIDLCIGLLLTDIDSQSLDKNLYEKYVINQLNAGIVERKFNNIEDFILYLGYYISEDYGTFAWYRSMKNALIHYNSMNIRANLIISIYVLIMNGKGDMKSNFEELRDNLSHIEIKEISFKYVQAMIYIDFIAMLYFGYKDKAFEDILYTKQYFKFKKSVDKNIKFFSEYELDLDKCVAIDYLVSGIL